MNENQKEFISIALTLMIVGFAVFIIHRFIPSLVWAGIIVISTFPLYRRWHKLFKNQDDLSALSFTFFVVLLFVLPLIWLITVLVKELQYFVNYLQIINREGGEAPLFLQELPIFGAELVDYWNRNFSHPGYIKYWLSNLHLSLAPMSYYIKQIGFNLAHRGFQLGFTLLSLFFFYRDGERLFDQINHVGEYCLDERWFRYADRLPGALRATVNGTIVVGMGVGILMGLCYGLLGFPAPTLFGLFTGFAAMVPFLSPMVFLLVALVFISNGGMLAAIIVIVWGTLVLFVADHFIKPIMIGGAIQLPFLAVLFGILGGVETLGLLGLFVGPIVMVLFMTLWSEYQRCDVSKHCYDRA